MINDPNQSKLERLIDEYIETTESGGSPDHESIIANNPELASELRSFFATNAELGVSQREMSTPLSEQPTVVANPHDNKVTHDTEPDTMPTQTASDVAFTCRYFGDYELLQEIARGGMGVVFKARQTKLNRIVALKMILAGELASEDDVKRFYTEAEAAARLDHPGIVPIHEIGELDGEHFFSMSFIQGESLADRIKDGPLRPREASEITLKVAQAVAYAHENGVIHRDLKPANILLDKHSGPRITDFGLAKKIGDDRRLTATGEILGTPNYMPPEQAAGKIHQIDERVDVYSLGAILYTLLAGRPPFHSASAVDILIMVMHEDPAPLRTLNPDVPADLENLVRICMEKNPDDRLNSAQTFADELGRFLRGDVMSCRPPSRVAQLVRWFRKILGTSRE